MHFTLRASEISPLVGRHIYRPTKVAQRDIVSMFHPVKNSAADKVKMVTLSIEDKVRGGESYMKAVRQRSLSVDVCREAERESVEIFDRHASSVLSQPDQQRLRRNIRSVYLKDRGIFLEKDVLQRLHETDVCWKPTEKQMRFFTRTFVHPNFSYTINGCVDALEFKHGVPSGLIEVKTRKDKIHFHTHELDQIMMYLVISGMPYGRLVQDVKGKIDTSFIMTLDEAEDRWDTIVRPLLDTSLKQMVVQIRSISEEKAVGWRPSRRRLAEKGKVVLMDDEQERVPIVGTPFLEEKDEIPSPAEIVVDLEVGVVDSDKESTD